MVDEAMITPRLAVDMVVSVLKCSERAAEEYLEARFGQDWCAPAPHNHLYPAAHLRADLDDMVAGGYVIPQGAVAKRTAPKNRGKGDSGPPAKRGPPYTYNWAGIIDPVFERMLANNELSSVFSASMAALVSELKKVNYVVPQKRVEDHYRKRFKQIKAEGRTSPLFKEPWRGPKRAIAG
jgi:hypothetical protein